MRIALAQINPTIGDFDGNLTLIESAYRQAGKQGADLVVFPELCLTGYPPRDLLERRRFRETCHSYATRVAALSGQTGLLFGAPWQESGGRLYNAALLAEGGAVRFIHRKLLLPSYDVFDETRYFFPGETIAAFSFRGENLGIMVCEDAWNLPDLPESKRYHSDPVADLVKNGATILINLSASPFQGGKPDRRLDIARHHVQAHQIPFFLVNQVGGNDELIFDGHSLHVHPGHPGAWLPGFQPALETVDSTQATEEASPPYGEEIAQVHDALVLGVRDYMQKCGFRKAVLGLSGGIDSALTAAIACRAIGGENVAGITMPSMYSSAGSVDDSVLLAKNLNMVIHEIPIKAIYDQFSTGLAPLFQGTTPGIAEENLQARIRGTLLMAVSNKFGQLLLSTGNKSELSMGYCTLYGDMNGGLAVLGDVLKTRVYALAEYVNREQEIIPRAIIDKPPSAELRPDQKDSDSLPPYPVLDEILQRYLEQGHSFAVIREAGYGDALVDKVRQAVDRNEYKRRQAPPVLRVSGKAFGSGRRMPIAAKY